ncbi:MAG TPA: tail fiber domain-containing protein, partial [Candidatus Udaeobacter sp.]|nr:tail fiber domain-containing protein [Candidatus Udaeobacter sp.]
MKSRRSFTIFTTIFSVLACCGLGFGEVSPAAPDSFVASNTFDGANALANVTSGGFNNAFGWYSLFGNTDAFFNTGVGAGTLALSNGADNTAVGAGAMLLNTTGSDNVAVGVDALLFNDTGSNNTATGSFALYSNTTGNLNTANGLAVLYSNTTGIGNTAEGGDALVLNDSGGGNTAIGAGALSQNIIGNSNIALGRSAGSQVTGDNNIDIGNSGEAAESDTIRIGNSFHTATYIAGILGNGPFSCDVSIDPVTGQLGVGGCISSKRFKKDIDSMDKTSEAIFSLKPVTFHYKNDKTNIRHFGLIAEEVAKVNPALIAVDKEGKPYSVRYEQINAMLLNEFLKEHGRNEEQQKQINVLTAQLKEQAAQIQKVSAQL